jgi:beta-glucosidase/6-phospho-beta-glucosidase/beta-galactosidase
MLKQLVFETSRKFVPIIEEPYQQLLIEILENRPDPVDTMEFFTTFVKLKHKFPDDFHKQTTKSFYLLFAANVKEIDKQKLAVWLVPHEVV